MDLCKNSQASRECVLGLASSLGELGSCPEPVASLPLPTSSAYYTSRSLWPPHPGSTHTSAHSGPPLEVKNAHLGSTGATLGGNLCWLWQPAGDHIERGIGPDTWLWIQVVRASWPRYSAFQGRVAARGDQSPPLLELEEQDWNPLARSKD